MTKEEYTYWGMDCAEGEDDNRVPALHLYVTIGDPSDCTATLCDGCSLDGTPQRPPNAMPLVDGNCEATSPH